MNQTTFDNALKLIVDNDAYFTIGGGEPLLHPLFMDFAWKAIRHTTSQSYSMGMAAVGLVTNGKCTKEAIEVARMAELGYISARLSLDQYHEPIEDSVKRAFGWNPERAREVYQQPRRKETDNRAIGGANYNIVASGRAKSWGGNDKCFCDSVMITPNGKIWHCGCKKVCFGNVNDPALSLPDYFGDILSEDQCSRKFTIPEPEQPSEPANLVLESV